MWHFLNDTALIKSPECLYVLHTHVPTNNPTWFRSYIWLETCLGSAAVPSEGRGHVYLSSVIESHSCCSSTDEMFSFFMVKEKKTYVETDHGSLRSWESQVNSDTYHYSGLIATHTNVDIGQGGPQE